MISEIQYSNAEGSVVRVVRDGVVVNSSWPGAGWLEEEIKEWLDAGNTIAAYVEPAAPAIDELYDAMMQAQQLLKAVVLALNDGTLVPGANATNAELKTAIKAKL